MKNILNVHLIYKTKFYYYYITSTFEFHDSCKERNIEKSCFWKRIIRKTHYAHKKVSRIANRMLTNVNQIQLFI